MDHPSGDGPNTYVVSRATKRSGITMALSGLGGDELFAGYPVFTRTMALWRQRWLAALPSLVRRAGASAVSRLKFPRGYHKLAYVMQSGSVAVDRTYPITRQVASDDALSAIMAPGLAPDRVKAITRDLLLSRHGNALPVLSQVSLLEISTYMQNVLLRDTDQMSMAHALEVRVPFLDHELVQFVLGVGDAMKYPHTPKELLTGALGDLLPREIVDRPKMGFVLPWSRWMREDLRSFCGERIERLGQRSAFNAEGLQALWTSFIEDPRRVSWARIWYLVVLEDWLERNGVRE
jgi:asparagine synthase (glutamine-hydrolysing)